MKGLGVAPMGNRARLIIAAAVLHLLLAISIYLTGRAGLWPTVFDTNGVGLTFAVDSLGYRPEAVSLTETLTRQGVVSWMTASSPSAVNPFHLKLYSLSFLIFGPLLGNNILAAEPLNLLYYLSIVCLVFALGREVFGERAGLLAALAVALWPSLLLHTTQLLRDPLLIASVLGLVLVCARTLTRDHSWAAGLKAGAAGSAMILLLWLLRREMWEVVLASLLVTAGLLMIRLPRRKGALAGNLLCVGMLLAVTLPLPRVWNAIEGTNYSQASPPGSGLPARITYLRHGFTDYYPGAGSNIDADVEFGSLTDVLLYLPRATSIGFFAPFPNMWFTAGAQSGLGGRLLAGFETFLMYVATLLAFAALWQHRRNLSAWLLLLVTGAGITALGLVVPNIGALYRMRYAYWIMLIILGAEGARKNLTRWCLKSGQEPPALSES